MREQVNKKKRIVGVLKRQTPEEYNFWREPKTLDGVWLTFGNYSIKIHKADEGVIIDLYGKGKEDFGILDSAQALDSDLDDLQDDDDFDGEGPVVVGGMSE